MYVFLPLPPSGSCSPSRKRWAGGIPIRSVMALEDDACPAMLQSCYKQKDMKFTLMMRRGMIIKVYDGCLQKGVGSGGPPFTIVPFFPMLLVVIDYQFMILSPCSPSIHPCTLSHYTEVYSYRTGPQWPN